MTERLNAMSVELETITPLWMGGAAYQPELRPPSFRGVLRYWLRALLGGMLGEDLGSLRAAEAAVLGDTQRASPLVVRIDGEEPRVGSAGVSAEEWPGVAYMFWSTYQRRRDAILPGETFDLQVLRRVWDFRPVEVNHAPLGEDEVFYLFSAALWLLLRLGGAGARQRRCAGGMQATASPAGWPANLPSPVIQASTPGELAGELSEGLRSIRGGLTWPEKTPSAPSSYDILHPNACRILVVDQVFPTWWEATEWVGRQLQEFRRSHRGDASAIAELLTRGRITATAIQRAVLGLPLVFFFKSIFETLTQGGTPAKEARRKATASVVPQGRLGRASPLRVRVVRLAGEPPRFAVTMTLFRSRFLPDRQMTIRPQDRSIRPVRVNVPENHALIDNWFDFLRAEGAELQSVVFDGEDS
ncbi:MAG: type III-B CRISPR module RAMP protein Cmr1 [Planctomycetota bacterium]